jgi:hypothetical protein
LQIPTFAGLEEQVLSNLEEMYRCIERDRPLVSDDRWFELQYEDLVREPMAVIERIYAALGLADFTTARPGVEEYCASMRDYAPNRHTLSDSDCQLVERRWGVVMRQYGYADEADRP